MSSALGAEPGVLECKARMSYSIVILCVTKHEDPMKDSMIALQPYCSKVIYEPHPIQEKEQRRISSLAWNAIATETSGTQPLLGHVDSAAPSSLVERTNELFVTGRKEPSQEASSDVLPIDPRLVLGHLDNGFTYYLQPNLRTPKHALLRLVVRGGFLHENERQHHAAHMVEHLVFRETDHFEDIHSVLQTKGIAYDGCTRPKYTYFDLDLPFDDPKALEEALLILSDMVHNGHIDDDKIGHEREILLQEHSLRENAVRRLLKDQFSHLLDGTRYLQNMESKPDIQLDEGAVRDFYRQWYRPDNMALVAVGDFDVDALESLVKKNLEAIPGGEPTPAKAPFEHLAPHKGVRVFCESDAEHTSSMCDVYYIQPPIAYDGTTTLNQVRQDLVDTLLFSMLNTRFGKQALSPSRSFIHAFGRQNDFFVEAPWFSVQAFALPGCVTTALRGILKEIELVKRDGFTKTEFDRAKKAKDIELSHDEKEKGVETNGALVSKYGAHFAEGRGAADKDSVVTACRKLLPSITNDDLRQRLCQLTASDNIVVTSTTPLETVATVTEEALRKVISDVASEPLAPYVDTSTSQPLMETLPTPGSIVSTTEDRELGITEYLLSNGIRVAVKTTSFVNDSIILTAMAEGGERQVPREQSSSAGLSELLCVASGLADFDRSQLDDVLGAQLRPAVSIDDFSTTIEAITTPENLEKVFQCVYLQFTRPRFNPELFDYFKQLASDDVRHRHSNPNAVFRDQVVAATTQDHPRLIPLTLEELERADFNDAVRFYRERFSNAADFDVVLVGNIPKEVLPTLLERYLASLPSRGVKNVSPDYPAIPFPPGIVKKTVIAGKGSPCITSIVFPADVESRRWDETLASKVSVLLKNRIFNTLRQRDGKNYAASVNFYGCMTPQSKEHDPSHVSLSFQCSPDQVDESLKIIFQEIQKLQTEGPTDEEVNTIKQSILDTRRVNTSNNSGWNSLMSHSYRWHWDLKDDMKGLDKKVDALTRDVIRDEMRHLFDLSHYVQVVRYPE